MKLFYKVYGNGKPVVVLHGLFGMHDNWRTFSRMTENQLQTVLADLRNHGRSPHNPEMNFTVMADDVAELISHLNLGSVTVLGHSMGGKVAMRLTDNYPELVEKLIVADIAPRVYPPHHQNVIRAIQAVEHSDMVSRERVEQKLSTLLEDDMTTIQFLMKNLSRNEDGDLEWKSNMDVIISAYSQIMESTFPVNRYDGDVLFLKGERSSYITTQDEQVILQAYPKAKIETIPHAGHWLHADQPVAFAETVLRFMTE